MFIEALIVLIVFSIVKEKCQMTKKNRLLPWSVMKSALIQKLNQNYLIEETNLYLPEK